jgi:hypothetical protein
MHAYATTIVTMCDVFNDAMYDMTHNMRDTMHRVTCVSCIRDMHILHVTLHVASFS